MLARSIFTRLSPLGVALLILIMVLMLYPVLPPNPQEAHAATRLGLHVTQEELNIWKQRRTDNANGIGGQTFQTIYNNRIKSEADNFKNQSHPGGDGYWVGYTGGGCYPGDGGPEPGAGNGNAMMKSAFHFLLTGDTSYANPVRSELLNQIAEAGTQWSNSSKWCPYNGTTNHIYSRNLIVHAPWLTRLILAYDYLVAGGYTGFTATEHTNIKNWFRDAGLVYDTVLTGTITNNAMSGAFNNPPDYTCDRACSGSSGITHFGGYSVDSPAGLWENQLSAGAVLSMVSGILVNDATLIRHARLYVEQQVMFSTYPSGVMSDQRRWTDCTPLACGMSSSWGHVMTQLANPIAVADYLARTGDTSLYTLSTTGGIGNTQGGPKSLGVAALHYARMANRTVLEYGTTNGSEQNEAHLLTWNMVNNIPSYGHLATMVSNVFYQNSEVRTANAMTENDSNCNSSGNGCYGTLNGIYPDLPFMWGNLDSGQINPYTTGGPTPTPTPTPTPSPCTPISYLSQTPTLPTTIEAENYNKCSNGVNGEGTTYHDGDSQNQGGAYRTSEGVDLESSTDTGGGYHISHTAQGEWTTYTINVPASGTYTTEFRVASNGQGGTFHIESNNQNLTGAVQITDTGAWTTWTTISKQVTLPQGTQTLKLVMDTNGTNSFGAGNINYLRFTQGATPTPTPSTAPTSCSLYTPSTQIPTGFGSPYDVVSSPNTNLMNVTCDSTSATITLGKGDPLQYIYNQGYLFKTGGTNWTPISYTSSEQLIANAWYPKTATTNITLTQTELANPNYNLAYICSWTGTNWKCGCRDSACTQSYWGIQSFKR